MKRKRRYVNLGRNKYCAKYAVPACHLDKQISATNEFKKKKKATLRWH